MRPVTLKMNLDAASATKVAASQTPSGAGAITLTAAASAIDSSGAERFLLFTTTENDSAINAVITGLDANGQTISETLALPNNTTKSSVNSYSSVSSITVSGALTAAMTVGTTNSTASGISKLIPLDHYAREATVVAIEITGTINFTIQETFDDVINGTTTPNNAVFFNPTALASKTSNTVAQLDMTATAVQILINSYSTGATLTARILQAQNNDLK